MTDSGIQIDRDKCLGCGLCAEICPANAMELLGKSINVDTLYDELVKDKTFYDRSGGGVTASGGEPTMQPTFVAHLFLKLQGANIHTALDTCGLCSQETLKKILPHTDLILFDLKEIDSVRHKHFTGQDNQIILKNLLFINNYITSTKPTLRLWIRTPLIPGATDNQHTLSAIGDFLKTNLPDQVERWELCAFNNLCTDKYNRLDREWSFANIPLMTQEAINQCASWAKNSGLEPERILTTGSAKME